MNRLHTIENKLYYNKINDLLCEKGPSAEMVVDTTVNEIRHKIGKGYSNCSTYIANITKDRQNNTQKLYVQHHPWANEYTRRYVCIYSRGRVFSEDKAA